MRKQSAAHSMEWYLDPDYDLNVDIFSQDEKGSSPVTVSQMHALHTYCYVPLVEV